MADQLEIRREGHPIASLQRRGSKLFVTYSPEVLQTVPAGTPVLSCSLPVRSTRLDATAWARGLLPEGQHLHALAARADVAASDTFGLLARFGRDIAGAFEIVAEQTTPRSGSYRVYDADELDAEVAALDIRPLGIHDDSELSLAGLQDKMVVTRIGGTWARPVHGYPSTHILKVDPHNRPGLVDAEAACLRLAHAVGLTDIEIERATFGGREVIIVSRFDRVPGADGVPRRLHQEDLLQALGVSPDGDRGRAKYQRSGSPGPPSWWHAADLLDTHADDLDDQLEQLLRIVAYTTVIANADCHAKNIAFLIEEGRVRLAPLYDTVPTGLWPELCSNAALSVNDVESMSSITLDDIVGEAQRWGMPADRARFIVEAHLAELVDVIDVSDNQAVIDLVETNVARLLG